jgi:hypothetical protein
MQVTGGQEQARLGSAPETRRRAVRAQSSFLAETGLLMRVSGEQVSWALPQIFPVPAFALAGRNKPEPVFAFASPALLISLEAEARPKYSPVETE